MALRIDWTHPVWRPDVKTSRGGSTSVEAKRALPAEEAYAFLAGDDPRPLLVLRECLTCTGTDDALLTRQADNEKTMLMSRWFHCVKLAPDVLEDDNPFRNLFAGDDPSHLFVAQSSGEGRMDLAGDQSRTELWGVMGTALDQRYRGSYDKALKELFRILDEFDQADQKIAVLETSLDDAVEEGGSKSSKVKKIKKELTKLHNERKELLEKADKVSRLELRKEK